MPKGLGDISAHTSITAAPPPPRRGSSPYRALLAKPPARTLLACSLFSRLPLGMCPLALILLVREHRSYAAAGLTVGLFAFTSAVTAPIMGRLVDRTGQGRTLIVSAALQAAFLVSLIVINDVHGSLGAIITAAALAGVFVPPVSACTRVLWPIVAPGDTEAAFALDAITQELIWTVGPLAVSVVAVLASPSVAIAMCALCVSAGTLTFARQPAARRWRPSAGPIQRGNVVRHPAVVALMQSTVLMGIAVGSVQVGLAALAHHVGAPGLAGLLLTLWSVGSGVGGLWYGAHTWSIEPAQRYVLLLAVFGLVAAPLLAATSLALALPFSLVAGLGMAPSLACQYILVSRHAPAGSEAEAFTWATAALVVGVAAGEIAGGQLITHVGVAGCFAVSVACPLVGSLLALRLRRIPPPAPSPSDPELRGT